MRISNNINTALNFNAYALDRADVDTKINAMQTLIDNIGAETVVAFTRRSYLNLVIVNCEKEEILEFTEKMNKLSRENAREFCEVVERLENKYSALRNA